MYMASNPYQVERLEINVDFVGLRERIKQAETSGIKAPLDMERALKSFMPTTRKDAYIDIKDDPRVIEETKQLYYLESPDSVKNTDDFINWLGINIIG